MLKKFMCFVCPLDEDRPAKDKDSSMGVEVGVGVSSPLSQNITIGP